MTAIKKTSPKPAKKTKAKVSAAIPSTRAPVPRAQCSPPQPNATPPVWRLPSADLF